MIRKGTGTPAVYEAGDGHDAIEWAGKQPWSNGKVGMWGISYSAYVQWLAALERSPYLKTLVPIFSPLNPYHDIFYSGGAFQLSRIFWAVGMAGRTRQETARIDWPHHFRRLPVVELDRLAGYSLAFWKDWVRHSSFDEYWEQISAEEELDEIGVPVLHIGGWFDAFLRSTLQAYGRLASGQGAQPRQPQKLMVGPWPHGQFGARVGDLDFGTEAARNVNPTVGRWMDYWLKGVDNGILKEPTVEVFVMGRNQWREAGAWPLPGVQYTPYYFHSRGRANGSRGDGWLSLEEPGEEPADSYVYDPENPVPTRGGNLPGGGGLRELASGPYDQQDLQRRQDVLVYTSEPLPNDLEVIGPVTVTLYAASSALDTDFTARLSDVHSNGRAYNLADGIVRARYRNSYSNPEMLEPGRVYEYSIDLVATSHLFLRGHRVRVDVSSSNFPRFDRNLNTGGPLGSEIKMHTAEQSVYHDSRHRSHITLPVAAVDR